mgnify:CR=1 FL=1
MNNPIPGIEERYSNSIPRTRHPLPKRLNENSKPNTESQMKTSGGARNCIMIAVKVILAGDYAGINGVALLCGLKVIGTFVVLGICRWIYARSRRIGVPVVLGLAMFQFWLLYYLHFGVGF